MQTTTPYLTLGQVARHFGCQLWQVRRVFERGLLEEPARVGAFRVIAREELHRLERALREGGYLPQPAEVQHAAD
jgi:hypothetical protein